MRILNHLSFGLLVVLAILCRVPFASAQTEAGSVAGRVTDASGAVIPNAEVELTSIDRGTVDRTTSNRVGIYVLPSVAAGRYNISVRHAGFRQVDLTNLTVNVQSNIEQNFKLEVGSVSESVTVDGDAQQINTTDASVSTVIDRRFVENIPLNGRSFQDLILLTPGVVTASPQSGSSLGGSGEFSVNGQRTESNSYSVDGVSANVGVEPGYVETPAASGSLPVSTALGTTQGLVSVDALQEFRIQSSTYSAEYGRNPGGEFSFVTRSGTNQWNGTAFDYLRNGAFDANDWFNDYYGKPQPALRQNDFGGTIGGPITIPRIYNGKDRTFFFFSYEGLRLTQPQAASVSYVPDTALRESAPAALQAVLNAFPLQNGPELGTGGLAEFIGTWSNPGQIDSTSIRLDHAINEKLRLFFRFSDTSSQSKGRATGTGVTPADVTANTYTTRSYTWGAASLFPNHLNNDVRLNYSTNAGASSVTLDNLGGALPVDLAQAQGLDSRSNPSYEILMALDFGTNFPALNQSYSTASQTQWNVVDSISWSMGHHQLKFGIDFRRLTPVSQPKNPFLAYYYLSPAAVLANNLDIAEAISSETAHPLYKNFSAFAQDEWKITERLNLSLGLRWEVNPAPGATSGNVPYTVQGNTLSTLSLAPEGTPLWQTTWYNFAPRLGFAYALRKGPSSATVVRGGAGVFFDTGQQLGSQGYFGPGFTAMTLSGKDYGSTVSFPAPLEPFVPTIPNPPIAPYTATSIYAFPQHLQLPYTFQWNASVEQAIGRGQTVTISYVGANGRKLLEQNEVHVTPFNPNFGYIYFYQNGLTSSYNALQIRYQRQLLHNLQVLASYTWSHGLDYGSENSALPYVRGNSDFDVRNNLAGALSYDLPSVYHGALASALLHHWGLDDRFSVRTAFPVTLVGQNYFDSGNGQLLPGGLNLISGTPIYLYGSQYPGGREINPTAFTPAQGGQVGTAPRNFARGFGASQMDLAVRRDFPLHERLKLQFRAETFNIFNHPNFGVISSTYCSATTPGCQFGRTTATLAQSLGVLSPLYQQGGPRSIQFALKLLF